MMSFVVLPFSPVTLFTSLSHLIQNKTILSFDFFCRRLEIFLLQCGHLRVGPVGGRTGLPRPKAPSGSITYDLS